MYSFPNFEPISSNCCFLTHIQVSQEIDKVVWYSHNFKNFPQYVLIHTNIGFNIVCEAEIDIFLEFPCFFYDLADVGNLISGSSAFSKSSLNIQKFSVHMLVKLCSKSLSSMWTKNSQMYIIQAGFQRSRGTRDQDANIRWITEKAREFQKNIYFCFIHYTKAFDSVDHNEL